MAYTTHLCIISLFCLCAASGVQAQPSDVLSNIDQKYGPYGLAMDRGSIGLWQQLQKLQTTASIMHTTAHPDDEHAGLLTYMSRGLGVRTALLTLNRGEAGANATGSELFDALGLVRTEELLRSGQYYGLDDQYFTSLVDYGYSKTLDEALKSWGREHVLRDMVRAIRINRPMVVVSRYRGSERDGHGHHQAVGALTSEAVVAAGDPMQFPEQIEEEGLTPWSPFRVYRGGAGRTEPGAVGVEVGKYAPLLADSYHNVGYNGLSLQRSQTSGRSREAVGSPVRYYERILPAEGGMENHLFDGLDTSLSGMYRLFDEDPPSIIASLLKAYETQLSGLVLGFDMRNPELSVKPLATALVFTHQLMAMPDIHPEVAFLLEIKKAQIEEAITTALGLRIQAIAMPAGAEQPINPWAPLPTLGLVVPGQTINVTVDMANPSGKPIRLEGVEVAAETIVQARFSPQGDSILADNNVVTFESQLEVPSWIALARPYFSRTSIAQNRYDTASDVRGAHLPHVRPPYWVTVRYAVEGVQVVAHRPVQTRRANLPYGYKMEPLKAAPRVAVNVPQQWRMAPLGKEGVFAIDVEVVNNDADGVEGTLSLALPERWSSNPQSQSFAFDAAGQRRTFTFDVLLPERGNADTAADVAYEYTVQVQSYIDGRMYAEGYEVVERPNLETRYLYRPATVHVREVDVEMAAGISVGYVMGVGDEVPDGIQQLGASVALLDTEALARSDLARFDVIVIGTRAYAVRQDLLQYNQRLLDYAKSGGHLVVLYQTPEFVPNEMAPFSAILPRNAEEISEQDAIVRILAPEHPMFVNPNRLSPRDFEGWIEQRGSKFFASWDDRYMPLIESADTNQDPQQGIWLNASYGEGQYTYLALALHRQLPYAVPGAYRILANVLSQ